MSVADFWPNLRAPRAVYRDSDDTALRQLRFLRRGQELGFTRNELTEFTALSAGLRSGVVDVGSATAVAVDKLQEIDGRIQDLQRTRDAFATLLHQQCIDPTEECPIVQALSVDVASSTR
jgi:DNA-binding transcriptional MerR regulator